MSSLCRIRSRDADCQPPSTPRGIALTTEHITRAACLAQKHVNRPFYNITPLQQAPRRLAGLQNMPSRIWQLGQHTYVRFSSCISGEAPGENDTIPWCTSMYSMVCSAMAERYKDGTHVLFINNPGGTHSSTTV
eukprot:595588-Prorocentrum_minimum.AAC.2